MIREVAAYELASSHGLCPTEDKIDLDSGRSGHGGQPQLGDFLESCRVDGGLAELILEDSQLHSPGNSQIFAPVEHGTSAGLSRCRGALAEPSRVTSQLPLSSLATGDKLCVRTELGNVGLVTITAVRSDAAGAQLSIAYTLWKG